jgi:hypothetical protein
MGPSSAPNKFSLPANLMLTILPFGLLPQNGRRTNPCANSALWLMRLYGFGDVMCGVTYCCLHRACVFLDVALRFKVFVANGLANDFLRLANSLFHSALDLMLIDAHDLLPKN